MRLPRVSGKETIDAFLRKGFIIHRIRGSHYILKSDKTGLRVTIPFHRKQLAPKTLQTILKQADITIEEFITLL